MGNATSILSKLLSGLFLMLLLTSQPAAGQVRDAGMWLSLNGGYRINPVLTLVLSEELRLNENFLQADAWLTDAGVEYEVGNHWRLSTHYRVARRLQPDQTYLSQSRLYGDVRYKMRLGTVDLLATIRMHYQTDGWAVFSENPDPGHYLRPEAEMRWRLSGRWRPYLSAEMYYPMIAWQIQETDKVRFTWGTLIAFNKVHALDVFFRVQQEYHVKYPVTDFIIGLGYRFLPRELKRPGKSA